MTEETKDQAPAPAPTKKSATPKITVKPTVNEAPMPSVLQSTLAEQEAGRRALAKRAAERK